MWEWLKSHEDLLGGILTLTAGLMGAFAEKLKGRKLFKWLPNAVIALTFVGGIMVLQSSLSAAKSQDAFQNRVKVLQDELLQKAKDINDSVTGGDNYCYIAPTPELKSISTQIEVYIANDGMTDCHDVHFQITPTLVLSDTSLTPFQKRAQQVTGWLPAVHGHKEPKAGDGYMQSTGTFLPFGSYVATIDERNGQVYEEFTLTWRDNKWHSAVKVVRADNQEVIMDSHSD